LLLLPLLLLTLSCFSASNGGLFEEEGTMVELRVEMRYVKTLLRSTTMTRSKMTREEEEDELILQAFPPKTPFPFPDMKKTLTTLKMMLKKKNAPPKSKPNESESDVPKSKFETETDTDDDDPAADETKKTKMKMKMKQAEDKEKKKMEEDPPPKDPDNDIGASPIDNPGEPKEEGNSFHLPSPIAPHLQGHFPGG
jgi:hypothetical protein